MNKRLTLQALAACTLIAAALAAPTAAHAQTKLKWAHVYETSEPYHKWSVWAGDEFKKRTAGRYEIQVFPASSLGKESDINQGLQLGTVDIILTGASFAARSFPRLAVSYYPFTFRDADHVLKYARSDVFRELADGYKKASGGNTITALTYYGHRHATSNKLFTNCDEMKGLKIRVPDVPAYLAMPKACGANPTPIAFAEVYLALQNGTVEAQENPLTTIEAKKFYEVQKNILLTGHIVDSVTTQVGPHVWSKLTDEEKKMFTDVMQQAAARGTAEIKAREAKLVDEFRKKGINVAEVDKESIRQAILKSQTVESLGYNKSDWEKIQALK